MQLAAHEGLLLSLDSSEASCTGGQHDSMYLCAALVGCRYNVRVASRYFKGPELLVDLQVGDKWCDNLI